MHGSARRVYALAEFTVERRARGWYFARTSRFGERHEERGPYSSEMSVALMIAREIVREILRRDAAYRPP